MEESVRHEYVVGVDFGTLSAPRYHRRHEQRRPGRCGDPGDLAAHGGIGDSEPTPSSAAGAHRSREASPVETVLDGALQPADGQRLRANGGDEGQRRVAVRDGRVERSGRSSNVIDVDPLLVLRDSHETAPRFAETAMPRRVIDLQSRR
jgi:hypothetical protein